MYIACFKHWLHERLTFFFYQSSVNCFAVACISCFFFFLFYVVRVRITRVCYKRKKKEALYSSSPYKIDYKNVLSPSCKNRPWPSYISSSTFIAIYTSRIIHSILSDRFHFWKSVILNVSIQDEFDIKKTQKSCTRWEKKFA